MPLLSKLAKPLLALAFAAVALSAARGVAAEPTKAAPTKAVAPRVVKLKVTDKGFEPSPVSVKKGEPLKLLVTRETENTCATELVLPEKNINTALPLNKEVEIAFTPDKAGTLKYGCAMGMMIAGVLKVE